MLTNYLSVSGTVSGIRGNDAYSPRPYWDSYTYRQLTSAEADALKNNNYSTPAFSLSPGQYTCLEIVPSGSIYIGLIRCYFGSNVRIPEFGLSIQQLSQNLSTCQISYSGAVNTIPENVAPTIDYWKLIYGAVGYFESSPVDLTIGGSVDLIDASYYTLDVDGLTLDSNDLSAKSVRQIVTQPEDSPRSDFIQVGLKGTTDGPTVIEAASIAPLITTISSLQLNSDSVSDHDVRGPVRYWISDGDNYGHFEGRDVYLDADQPTSGTWTEQLSWSGTGASQSLSPRGGYTIRQLIPYNQISYTGDGLRLRLLGSDTEDVTVNNLSYMPANSTKVTLDFQTNSVFEQVNVKGSIIRWKSDQIVVGEDLQGVGPSGDVTASYVEIEISKHYGHFEEGEIDFDDGSSAIMFTENVIGFRCTNHGLSPGDYIAIYGTNFYNGHYVVLTFSTVHIIYVWGIYDPETFTATAKVRKIVSLGPETDMYGQVQNCRDVVPYCKVTLTDGSSCYITSYSEYGKGYASVEVDEAQDTLEVTSIYDLVYDSSGCISSSPGPSVTAGYQQDMPCPWGYSYFKSKNLFNGFTSIEYEHNDPGWGFNPRPPEKFSGSFWVITEAQDPETEGDLTGWGNMPMLFDRCYAQPWRLKEDCPWYDLSYRGPMPVKFCIDMGSPKAFGKYRFYIQTAKCGFLEDDMYNNCPDSTKTPSYPRSWKLQASNVRSDNDEDWVTLEHVTDFPSYNFTLEEFPMDGRIPFTDARGPWHFHASPVLYRYYRFYIYDVSFTGFAGNKFDGCALYCSDTTNIAEIDFIEHRSITGLVPTIITSTLKFDRVDRIEPLEHMIEGNTAYYAVSVDGLSFYSYVNHAWKNVVKYENDTWMYYRGEWRNSTDNNNRRALWHAFSSASNRMDSMDMELIPTSAYTSLIPASGTYLSVGVGLVSHGIMDALVSGINVYGSCYNPDGLDSPIEITFSGSSGCTIPSGQIVTSDWVNAISIPGYDLLFVADISSSSESLTKRINTSLRYFERPKYTSYDKQIVTVSDYTVGSGILLVDSVDIRNSDLVILPATSHDFSVTDIVTITGTQYCEGRKEVAYAVPDYFGYHGKHYIETISVGAKARLLVPVGIPTMNSGIQVGSILSFSQPGSYLQTTYIDAVPSGFYFVTESRCQPGREATFLFDSSEDNEFFSLDPVSYGPVYIGFAVKQPKQFSRLRIKASTNYYYWDVEFPKEIEIAVSNLSSPVLTSGSHWTSVYSGTCSLPTGPGNFSSDHVFTTTGVYNNYRVKILSNYGSSTDCIRINKMELYDDAGLFQGYTVVERKPGFDSRYLFDSDSYTQFVSDKPLASGVVNIGIDFKGKPTKVIGFNLTSIVDAVSPAAWGITTYQYVSPKVVSFWLSRLAKPDLNNDSQWIKATAVTYAQPVSPGVQGSTITIPHPPPGAITQTEGILVGTNTVAGVSGRTTVDASWSLDNGQVIKEIGFGSPRSGNYLIKLCKDTGDEIHWDVIQDVVTVNFPSAINYQYKWAVLDAPLLVPSSGKYCLAVYFSGAVGSYAKSSSNWLHYTGEATVGLNRLFSYYTTAYTLPLAVRYMADDGTIPVDALHAKLKIESVWGGVTYNAELAGMNITTEELLQNYNVVTYSGVTYPFKLLDLPPNYQITGGTVAVPSGFAGGYVEEAGTVVPITTTGSYLTSFWTIVDQHWQLENGKSIAQIGIDCNTATTIKARIFKQRDVLGERFDVAEVASLSHTGSGFQWFTLSSPYLVPNDSGAYYLGWYQANYPRYMGDATGSGLVSYEYGDQLGMFKSLPYHNTMRPHLGVRYGNYYSIGISTASGLLYPLLSPCTDGSTYYITNAYGPLTESGTIYLYRPCTFIQPNTKGCMNIVLNYEDTLAGNYGAWNFTTSGTQSGVSARCFSSTRLISHLFDDNPTTYYHSYRRYDITQDLNFIVRFDRPTYISAYRLRATNDTSYYSTRFPAVIDLDGSPSPRPIDSSLGWSSVYYDDGYLGPTVTGYTTPWVYIDDYGDENYRYYRFDLYHPDRYVELTSVAELGLLTRQYTTAPITVTGSYDVITSIGNNSTAVSGVSLLYNAGSVRPISAIYNTFTNYNQNELSPGTYFYRGENNLSISSSLPQSLSLEYDGETTPITYTVPEMDNMEVLAWHTLNEETGDYSDLSGFSVSGTRVGTIRSIEGKVTFAASIDDADDDGGGAFRNIRFTLPHHLEEYTVSFWFKPTHQLTPFSSVFDIMGGWITLGAVPGVWHISFAQSFLFIDSPYPNLQPVDNNSGALIFGNYAKAFSTPRVRWPYQTWHHIVFSFNSVGVRQCWINSENITARGTTLSSNVYPDDFCIMADPADINYDDHLHHNCTYFGLPFEGADGTKGEFGLDNVIHFGKILSDAEVFKLYRLREPSLVNDGIYFANKLSIPVPSRLIMDFGKDVCLTRIALNAAYTIPAPGPTLNWSLQGLEDDNWNPIVVRSGVINPPSTSGQLSWNNFLNKEFYSTYSIEFLNTTSGLDLSSVHFSEVPFIPSVSGTYVTNISGIHTSSSIIGSQVVVTSDAVSVDRSTDGATWYSFNLQSLCSYPLGSTDLFIRNTFSGEATVYSPQIILTDWVTQTPTPLLFTGNSQATLGADETTSDFSFYSTQSGQTDLVIIDIQSGNLAQSDLGRGYWVGEGTSTTLTGVDGYDYICSGTIGLSSLRLRYNDLIALPASPLPSEGDNIDIYNVPTYSGVYSVEEIDAGKFHIRMPRITSSVVGGYYRKVIGTEPFIGANVKFGSAYLRLLDSSEGYSTLSSGIPSQTVSGICTAVATGSGMSISYAVPNLLTSGNACFSTTSGWVYNNVGRISSVGVSENRPLGTDIYHLITFDSGSSYKIYDNSWVSVLRNNGGQWQYYKNGWVNDAGNTCFSAYHNLINNTSYRMNSTSLSGVTEYNWHVSGGASSSGSIGFLHYLQSYNNVTPQLDSITLRYVDRTTTGDQTWAGYLIPSGYGFTTISSSVSVSGTFKDISFTLDTPKERAYGGKYTDRFRLYIAVSGSSVPVTEVALLNPMAPNDDYYLSGLSHLINNCPVVASGNVLVPELTDGYIHSGGILLLADQTVKLEITNIPTVPAINAGEFRIYFDPTLDAPTPISIASSSGTLGGYLPGTFTYSDNAHEATHPFSATFDGSVSTGYWSGRSLSTSNPIYLYMASPADIAFKFSKFRFMAHNWNSSWSYDFPKALEVHWSDNGSTWTTLQAWSDIGAPPGSGQWGSWVSITSAATQHRYWRFKVTSCRGTGWLGFAETGLDLQLTGNFPINLINSSTLRFVGVEKHSNYYSCPFWSTGPLTKIAAYIGSSDVTGSGIVRVTELAILPISSNYNWSIPDNFNLLESAYSYNTTWTGTTYSGYNYYSMPANYLQRIFNPEILEATPIMPSGYIGIQSDLGNLGSKASEFRCYLDSTSGISAIFFSRISGTTWRQHDLTWSGSYYSFLFPYEGITGTKMFCLNTTTGAAYSDIRWCKALQLINDGAEVDFGSDGTGSGTLDLPTNYYSYDKIKIYNNNTSSMPANARVLPRFSNNYHLDRVVKISENGYTWSHLDIGYNIPEDTPFDLGTYSGTELNDSGHIQLVSTATSGTWTSPIIEVLDPSSNAMYVYGIDDIPEGSFMNKDLSSVMNIVEVRTSFTKPMQSFLVTALNTEALDGIQVPWKMVAFTSDGSVSTWNAGSASLNAGTDLSLQDINRPAYLMYAPRRYWSYLYRFPLWQFYGTLDSRGYGSISLGLRNANSPYAANLNRSEDWYKLYSIYPSTETWSSTQIPAENSLHIYSRTNIFFYPVFFKSLRYTMRSEGGVNKPAWHAVDVVYRDFHFYERYEEQYYSDRKFHLRNLYSFLGNANTPEYSTEIDYLYSFPGAVESLLTDDLRIGACRDNQGSDSSYWIHYANSPGSDAYYITLLITNDVVVKEFTTLEYKFNYMVAGSVDAPSGFWGLEEKAVHWIEFDGTSLVSRYSVTADNNGKAFKFVTFGHIDGNNNLWFVDLATERVIRVNYENLTLGIEPVDYNRIVRGASSVYPDPYDGSAYVYVIRDPEFPSNDCIKIVHVGEYDYILPEVVCAVPGTPIIESFNVNLYGRTTYPPGNFGILANDAVWKNGGTAAWQNYSAGSPTLPKGHYKQIRATLMRPDITKDTPQIECIRIPKPALINKIPWHGYKDILIDTLLHTEETELIAGEHTLDLLVWWPRE
jgi:hypothetical protein